MSEKNAIGKPVVEAVYDQTGTRNPLIEALLSRMPLESVFASMRSYPALSEKPRTLNQRKAALAQLPTIFTPLPYMYSIYDSLFRISRLRLGGFCW